MSEWPDHDRVRALLDELDKVQGESERIRAKIARIRRRSPEFPDRQDVSHLYGDDPDSSERSPY